MKSSDSKNFVILVLGEFFVAQEIIRCGRALPVKAECDKPCLYSQKCGSVSLNKTKEREGYM